MVSQTNLRKQADHFKTFLIFFFNGSEYVKYKIKTNF